MKILKPDLPGDGKEKPFPTFHSPADGRWKDDIHLPCAVDEYSSDSTVFSAYGYTLHIQNELVANAFASLPEQKQKILILRYVLELANGEIGGFVGLSRSAVKRHRTKTLSELRKNLGSKGVRTWSRNF